MKTDLSRNFGYQNVSNDTTRAKAALSPPWRVQPIDHVVSEIVSQDGQHIVGHITNDCQDALIEMQHLAHFMSGNIHLGLRGEKILVGAVIENKAQLRKLIRALETNEQWLPEAP